MKNVWVWTLAAAVILLAGCESQELVTCRQDNQLLVQQTETLQQQLNQSNAENLRKDNDIERIKSENVEMQNKALEGIMTMLRKEEERRKSLQTAVDQKDEQLKAATDKSAASEQLAKRLQQQVETLKADLAKANQAIETLKTKAAEQTTN